MPDPDSQSASPAPAELGVFTKRWWQSKAILGGIVAILSGAVQAKLGYDVGAENIGEIVFGLAAAVGGGLAIYGRVKAQTVISK